MNHMKFYAEGNDSIELHLKSIQLTSIHGIPINFNRCLHSSLCCLVTLTSRRLNLSIFSTFPKDEYNSKAIVC